MISIDPVDVPSSINPEMLERATVIEDQITNLIMKPSMLSVSIFPSIPIPVKYNPEKMSIIIITDDTIASG